MRKQSGWRELKQLALAGSSSSLRSGACGAVGAADGVLRGRIFQRRLARKLSQTIARYGASSHVFEVTQRASATF